MEELGYLSSITRWDNSKVYTFEALPKIVKVDKSNRLINLNAISCRNSKGNVESAYNPNSEIREKQKETKRLEKIRARKEDTEKQKLSVCNESTEIIESEVDTQAMSSTLEESDYVNHENYEFNDDFESTSGWSMDDLDNPF